MLSPPSFAGLGVVAPGVAPGKSSFRGTPSGDLWAHSNVTRVPGRRKRLALIAAIMGSFVAGLDATAVNVALPAIRADLGGGLAGQQWVSNAYLLSLGSLILVGGSLGDLFGERRVFSIGVGGFGVVSLLCAIAPSIDVPDRLPRAPGRVRRAADAEFAGRDRGRVPARGTWRRDRLVDGVVGDRHGRSGRSPAAISSTRSRGG